MNKNVSGDTIGGRIDRGCRLDEGLKVDRFSQARQVVKGRKSPTGNDCHISGSRNYAEIRVDYAPGGIKEQRRCDRRR